MARITQKNLDTLLVAWVTKIGGRLAEWYGDIGAYHFENSYGQNRIVRIMNNGGGIDDVSPRLSSGELYEWMFAGIKAIDEYRRNKEEG